MTNGIERILNMPRASVERRANQTTVNAVPLGVAWDTLIYDTDGMWSATVLPQRFTVRTDGIYLVICTIAWDANNASYRQLLWFKSAVNFSQDVVNPVQGGTTNMTASRIMSMRDGDSVEWQVAQVTGGNLNITGPTPPNVSAAQICMISTL